MTDYVVIIDVVMFFFFSLMILWHMSLFVIRTKNIARFTPFFIIGILFAYFGAFVFFRMFYSSGWLLLKGLEVFAFVLLYREIQKFQKYD